MPRSLRVHSQHLGPLKAALLRHGFPSQRILAENLGLSQSTVSNFLNGKPIDYLNFVELCQALGQEWRDLADCGDTSWGGGEDLVRRSIFLRDWQGDRPPLPQGTPLHPALAIRDLHQALGSAGHDVLLGTPQVAPGAYLPRADYWILPLCPQTLSQELLWVEVQMALSPPLGRSHPLALLPLWFDPPGDPGPWEPLSRSPVQEVIQALQMIPLWRCPGSLTTLLKELLPLLREGRRSLTPQHPWICTWADLMPPPRASAPAPPPPLELPDGQLIPQSRFYIARPPWEERCWQALPQPGSLIRIKAPRQMGKTSLLARLLQGAESQGHRVISLNLRWVNRRIFQSSDTFLQWFCGNLALELGLMEGLNTCWQWVDVMGSNQCCKMFLEQQVLQTIGLAFTLALDEVDRLFEFPEIADDFFGLLRAVHEEAKCRPLWQKLHLIVVHSTEVYIPLNVNKSPFNVGLAVELPEFTPSQVEDLARRHGLEPGSPVPGVWPGDGVGQLMNFVGGHPYLIRLALHHLTQGDLTWVDLMERGATDGGLYGDHLRRHRWNLEQSPTLWEAWGAIITQPHPIPLDSTLAFKLASLGLVTLSATGCQVSRPLYRQYFYPVFSPRSKGIVP